MDITKEQAKQITELKNDIAGMEGEHTKYIKFITSLVSFEGFYNEYVKRLKVCKRNKAAFDQVNELFFEYFGFYKYSDYKSFAKCLRDYRNKK